MDDEDEPRSRRQPRRPRLLSIREALDETVGYDLGYSDDNGQETVEIKLSIPVELWDRIAYERGAGAKLVRWIDELLNDDDETQDDDAG